MITKKQIVTRCVIGGLAGIFAALLLILVLNLILNQITWGGSSGQFSLQLTTDRAAAHFGSAGLAVLIEMLVILLCGACVGLTTLPFSDTWTNLPGISALHFVLTGALVELLGWSYQWLGVELGWLLLPAIYAAVYLLIWLVRWLRWSAEVRQLRKALGLNQQEDSI